LQSFVADSQLLPGEDLGLRSYNIDSLKSLYGKNKTFIREYELPSLLALSYYPELKETIMTFKLKDEESTGKTTIAFTSFFKNNKKYIIYINRNKKNTGILLNEAPLNAEIGVIGHELSHVVDFAGKDIFSLTGWGFRYLNKSKRKDIERQTDMATIKHGLGRQLYDWNVFIVNNKKLSEAYRSLRLRYYMHKEEILELIRR